MAPVSHKPRHSVRRRLGLLIIPAFERLQQGSFPKNIGCCTFFGLIKALRNLCNTFVGSALHEEAFRETAVEYGLEVALAE